MPHKRGLEFSHEFNQTTLRSQTLRVLCNKLTLSGRATVCCLSWAGSGDGAASSADMFTMRRAGLCQAGSSRVWICLRSVLGIWLGGGAVGQSRLLRRGRLSVRAWLAFQPAPTESQTESHHCQLDESRKCRACPGDGPGRSQIDVEEGDSEQDQHRHHQHAGQ